MPQVNVGTYLLILLMVMLSAFFSASETAYSSVNRIRLKNYAAAGNKRAEKALKVAADFDRALSAILIGNNVVNIASASLGTVVFTALLGPSGVGVSTLVMTLIVLTFGEILPKSFAKENAEAIALRVATPLSVLIWILTPFIWFFVQLKKPFIRKGKAEPSVTEEELKTIIEEIEDEGVLGEEESELMQSALAFDDITAEEILTPRVDLVAVDISADLETIKSAFIESHFSRIPVYDKTIDSIEGILYERDFMTMLITGKIRPIRELMRETIFIPPSKKISQLLRELQAKKLHIAVVTDQYGGTIGIVTLEDILEELVGDIWDEHDVVTHEMIQTAAGGYSVSSDMNIFDLLEELEVKQPDFELQNHTVGGFVIEMLAHIPEVGESVQYQNLKLTVTEMDDQRIMRLLVEKSEEKPAQQNSEN